MGRRKKYFSPEEKKEADREKVLRYYWKNKELCDQKSRDRYRVKKLAKQANTDVSGSVVQAIEEIQLQIPQEVLQINE